MVVIYPGWQFRKPFFFRSSLFLIRQLILHYRYQLSSLSRMHVKIYIYFCLITIYIAIYTRNNLPLEVKTTYIYRPCTRTYNNIRHFEAQNPRFPDPLDFIKVYIVFSAKDIFHDFKYLKCSSL